MPSPDEDMATLLTIGGMDLATIDHVLWVLSRYVGTEDALLDRRSVLTATLAHAP